MNDLTTSAFALLNGRRSFLLRSAGTLAFPMVVVGCGGGGSSDDGSDPGTGTGTGAIGGGNATAIPGLVLTKSNAKGAVVLPAGASVKVASVDNAFGTSTPAADGSFDFVSVAESEMFAIAIGPGGRMVLAGLLQAGTGTTQLSARSTAICLAYTAIGVGVYLPSTQEQYLAAIPASAAFPALEAAVAAAIVARGEAWLDLTDATLKGALSALLAALSPAVLGGVSATPATAGTPEDAKSNPQGRVNAKGMVIDKTARTSGLQITGDGVATITITNFYRRRSYAYIDRLSYKQTFDGPDFDSQATVGVQPMKIDATKAITNSLTTLASLFAGVKDFYDPVVYDGIPTPIAPDGAALTTYRVVSVGLGTGRGDLDSLTDTQRTGLRNVMAETFLLDIVVPVFCGILIPIRTAGMATFIETYALSRLKDLLGALAATDDILLNKVVAANRPLGEVLWDTLLTLVNSDSFKNAILGFFQDCIDSLSAQEFAQLPKTNVVNIGAKGLLDALALFDLTAQTMDLVATGLSFLDSDLADRFMINVTKGTVRLNPMSPSIDPTSLLPTNFTLSVIDSDLLPGDLSYQWTCASLFGDIGSSTHSSAVDGTSFPSDSPNLAYAPRGHGKGGDRDVITGTVYKGSVLSTRVPIGTATSTISYNTAISPAAVQMVINTPQTFTADISANVLASGAALNYVWTVAGGGTVGGSTTTTTTTPSVVYTAPANATSATLTLSVRNMVGTEITKGSATIGVLSSVAVGIAPQNPQVVRSTTLNLIVNPIGAAFPDGTTFKWVLTHELDLFGRMQDLRGSGGGTIGVNIGAPDGTGPAPIYSVTVTTTTPTITFGANPFGPESNGNTFVWNPTCLLTVTAIGAGGSILATSSTKIYTQIPTSILLP